MTAEVWTLKTDLMAQLSKEHSNCNMISLGQRMMTKEQAIAIVDTWLNSEFKAGGHQRRIDQIDS